MAKKETLTVVTLDELSQHGWPDDEIEMLREYAGQLTAGKIKETEGKEEMENAKGFILPIMQLHDKIKIKLDVGELVVVETAGANRINKDLLTQELIKSGLSIGQIETVLAASYKRGKASTFVKYTTKGDEGGED